jgi:hypothetical protein
MGKITLGIAIPESIVIFPGLLWCIIYEIYLFID